MKYTSCPDCGANLDHGETCDCKKNNGSPNANQYDPRTTPSHHSIAQSAKKCKQNLLRDLRVTKKIPAKDMIDLVREHYPKYDKALQSKCEHGDEYGIDIRSDAMDALLAKFAPEQLEAEKHRRNGKHRLTKRIMCRLEDDDYDRLVRYIKDDGFDQMNAWLVFIVRQYIKSKEHPAPSEFYDIEQSVEAQSKFCKENGIPNFAPALDGKCYRCNRSIYKPYTHPDGHTTGITVDCAGKTLITGCPHCHYSFVD